MESKTTGYQCRMYDMPVKRYCQTMDLKNDEALIAKYKKAHDRYHAWPEIREGIRAVGILEMEIYILGTRLVMIVDTPDDFDWQTAMDKLATMPRQAEWEAFVAKLQGCRADARSDEKWQMMEKMFYLYE